MPGPVVHTIISEHLPGAFANANFQGSQQIANAMRKNKTHRRAMTYGAMGPDPFFFNLNDLPFMPGGTAKAVISAWNQIAKLRMKFHDLMQPLLDARRRFANMANKASKTLSQNSVIYRKVRNTLIRMREVGRAFSAMKRAFIKKFILNNTDPFGLYVSSYQQCESDHRKWWWFDTLHTRQTGDFVTQLFDIARGQKAGANGRQRNRSLLLSYATGYLSHLAADVVGHAYVNTIVGGPYRLNHAQRHTTQEKLMDVWAYDYYYKSGFLQQLNNNVSGRYYMNPEAINSGLHKNQQFLRGNLSPHQYQINNNRLFQRKKPSKPINSALKLPSEISKNFAHAATQLYNTDPNSGEYGPLTPKEVDLSYRLWYVVLRNSTNTRNIVKPKNLPGGNPINKALQNQWQKLKNWIKNNLSGNPFSGGGGGQCGGGGGNFGQQIINCLKSAAQSLANFMTNLAKSIINLVRIVAQIIRYVIAKLLTLPLDFLDFLLGRLYQYLYEAYRKILLLITALGFGYCYSDQLHQPQLHHMTDPTQSDAKPFNNTVSGRIVKPGQSDSGYPRLGPQMGNKWNQRAQGVMQGIKNEGHLVIPTRGIGGDPEYPKTIPGPDEYASNTPEVFITDPNNVLNFDPKWIPNPAKRDPRFNGSSRNANTTDPSAATGTPSLSDFHPGGQFSQPVLGNAVELTVELARQYFGGSSDFRGVPNLNMSGDRGIGYPTWANARDPPCTSIQRARHQWLHGKQIQWLNGGTPMTVSNPSGDPLYPVFEPDVRNTPPGY